MLRVTAPLLDGCWQDDATAFVGALDGAVSRLDISTGQATQVGSHMDGVKCTEWLEHQGAVSQAAAVSGCCCCCHKGTPGRFLVHCCSAW